MREIKFRALEKASNYMFKILSIDFDKETVKVYKPTYHNELNLKDVELMQFTGTFDDDGTEIYKGDIVFCDNEDGFCLFLVKFGENEKLPETVFASFYLNPIKQFNFSYEADNWNENDVSAIDIIEKYNPEQKNFVIIGNIYENPELLEG